MPFLVSEWFLHWYEKHGSPTQRFSHCFFQTFKNQANKIAIFAAALRRGTQKKDIKTNTLNNTIINLKFSKKMKRFALALLCIVSVAFFASCNKEDNPKNPSISVYAPTTDFVQDGATVDYLADSIKFGFQMASNADSQKELASLRVVLTINSVEVEWANIQLSGTTYTYTSSFSFGIKEIIRNAVITATVTDADNNTATTSITLHVDFTDSELEVTDFEWYRWGDHEQHGLEEFGLYWDKNRNAVIVPTEGTGLFTGFTKEEWDAVTTESQKIAFMLNAIDSPQHTASEYTGISTNGSGPVRDVILTITADGCGHLIYIDKIQFGEFGTYGYPMTVTGQAK